MFVQVNLGECKNIFFPSPFSSVAVGIKVSLGQLFDFYALMFEVLSTISPIDFAFSILYLATGIV